MTDRIKRIRRVSRWWRKLTYQDPGPTCPITAKSVVFDIADNWGHTSFVGVRSIEFSLAGSVISLPSSAFTAAGTSQFNANFAPEAAFDTTRSKTGAIILNSWVSLAGSTGSQRLIVVFNDEQTFDEIIVNNYHNSGANVDAGARNVRISYSPDTITDTAYNAAIPNGVELINSEWAQHVVANQVDDQTVWQCSFNQPVMGDFMAGDFNSNDFNT